MERFLHKTITKSFATTFILILSTACLFATNPSDSDDSDERMKISLMLNSAGTYERELFVMADENATSGYDSDFDTEIDNIQDEDMYWLINSGKFIDQGIKKIVEETVIKLGLHTDTNGYNTISIHKLENIPSTMKIFVHDKVLGEYYNIKNESFEVYLEAGVYLNRFEIVFSQPETLSVSQFQTNENQLDIRFDYATDTIEIVNNSNVNIESIDVYSLLGQSVYKSNTSQVNNKISINTNSISTGTYVVIINTENGINSKKILVN
ncbi:T9SS type A sorting domain-containing protein [Psychroserpens sp. AS72]|uniref:T9SS type A sorting domain-containing protein n=1 Tax=Psychroserpens sp. AS72 TaxID=3135775 RepID=UPI0031744E15